VPHKSSVQEREKMNPEFMKQLHEANRASNNISAISVYETVDKTNDRTH